MPKPFAITFTDKAMAAAEASHLSLADIEAKARAGIDTHALWPDMPGEMDELPSWGFLALEMPDGTEFFTTFNGPDNAEIDAVARHESLGPIEDTNRWQVARP